MSELSWGKCKIEKTTCIEGAPAPEGPWTAIDTPKENTTRLVPTPGKEMKATEEGGGLVDIQYGRTTYVLEFDLFVKKGTERPFVDDDGVVAGEHSFRITPEDTACEGIQIDRSVVRVEENYTTEEGILLHHVVQVLKPASGKSVKPYTAG